MLPTLKLATPSSTAHAGDDAPGQSTGSSTEPSQVPEVPRAVPTPQAWGIDFSTPAPTRHTTRREREALLDARLRRLARGEGDSQNAGTTGDSEGNTVCVAASAATNGGGGGVPVVRLDGLADRDALIPRHLSVTRADLEARFVLRQPRLLCINKQYPRSCGVSSLTSIYNYLYSWIGESAVGQHRPPVSQEEVMTALGFEPPFGDIHWGPFTGNATLIRWFHALNAHYGLHGKASILYKEHGSGKTTHLYDSPEAALTAVKAALRDPHCALIYHCHNHYMVPVGYQDIPRAQTDFFRADVPESSCETTIFIGEVSRGKHEAMYARRWSEIVQDLQCASPYFFNIRHPELGVQRKPAKSKPPAATATADEKAETPSEGGAVPPAQTTSPQRTPRPKGTSAASREPNNLHCLILFRNDVAEEHPERFTRACTAGGEQRTDEGDLPATAAADESGSSSRSDDDG